MSSFEDILREFELDGLELQRWIEQSWVRPTPSPEGFFFDEVDEARIALIRDLRRDLMVDDEVLGLVLSLLDQLYTARTMLHTVEEAIAELPTPLRDAIRDRLRRPPER
jgi:chaperone modulatory protein CbpM